jgi:threonyl-tRNA synthetase
VVPVHKEWSDYCHDIQERLHNEGFYCDVDNSKATFQKKVHNAQNAQYNFELVVGEAEAKNGTVNIGTCDNKVEGKKKVDDLVEYLKQLRAEHK